MKKQLTTLKWLLKREYWEHKGLFFWVPIVIAGLVTVFFLSQILWRVSVDPVGMTQFYLPSLEKITHASIEARSNLVNMNSDLSVAQASLFANVLSTYFYVLSIPVFFVYGICFAFFSSATLSNEKATGSLLFWKSLPFSDGQSVFAKLFFGLVVAPLFAWLVAAFAWFLAVLIYCVTCAAYGQWVFGAFFLNSTMYLTPLSYLLLLPVYIIWALPMAGWLFMVSSYVRKNTQIWGVGLPLAALGIGFFVQNTYLGSTEGGMMIGTYGPVFVSIYHELGRIVGGVIPGFWIAFNENVQGLPTDGARIVTSKVIDFSWLSLAQFEVWIAASIGVAMIFIATRLRRFTDGNG
jgi:ABC-2 type transport system permease protein